MSFGSSQFSEADTNAVAYIGVVGIEFQGCAVFSDRTFHLSHVVQPVAADIQAHRVEINHRARSKEGGVIQGFKGIGEHFFALVVDQAGEGAAEPWSPTRMRRRAAR